VTEVAALAVIRLLHSASTVLPVRKRLFVNQAGMVADYDFGRVQAIRLDRHGA
jgi:hypothetical protein